MRKNAAPLGRAALVVGLLLVAGLAGAGHAGAAAGPTPWLGVYMQEFTPELREGMDYRGDGGVIVSRVVRGGPAERAGLRNGDVIVRINSRTVASPDELRDVIRTARVGQSVSVELFRDGDRHVVSVWLDARPGDTAEGPLDSEAPAPPAPPARPAKPARPAPGAEGWADRDVVIRGLRGLEGLDLPEGSLDFLRAASRGRLGVRIESLSPALGDYFGLKDGKGALVLEVLEDTPAERAGLLPGDVITRVGDQAVTNGSDLVDALRGKGGRVALRVVRHGTPRTIEAELEKPEPERIRILEGRPGDRPGVQKRIIVRKTDRDDLRHELDRLKEQMEELRQRLDEQQEDEGQGE